MPDLYGQATFSDDVVRAMSRRLQTYGFPLPQFAKIGGILTNQLPAAEAQHHARWPHPHYRFGSQTYESPSFY